MGGSCPQWCYFRINKAIHNKTRKTITRFIYDIQPIGQPDKTITYNFHVSIFHDIVMLPYHSK